MKRIGHIVVVLLLPALQAAAQDKGDVVVHADPRLSILMKKKHEEASASGAKPRKHTTDIKTPVSPVQVNTVTPAVVVATTGRTSPVTTTVMSRTPPPSNPIAAAPAYVPEPNTKPEPAVARAPIYIREKEGRVIYNGKGFRVQIYSGADRERAIAIKTEFMRNFPGVRTYISYVSPCFRVKVGNYRTRAEAMSMYKEARGTYTPCVIVPDMITINTM